MKKRALETQVEDAAVQAGGLLRSKYGLWTLAGVSFIESALVVPLITDPFLIAYILADRKSVYKGVLVTTCASIVGGVFAYVVALSFYEFLAEKYLVGAIGDEFYYIIDKFQEGTFMVTLLGAVTPVPYTLVAMGAGFIKGSFLLFIAASILGRGFRYTVVGTITYKFGEQALGIIRKRILLVSVLVAFLVLGYFSTHW